MSESASGTPHDKTAVNVLDLGAKNDASEDVSELVNRYSQKYAIFFPAGQYKVSHPLRIKNPIYGTGYSRSGQMDSGHTWLVSAIEHSNVDPLEETGVICFGGNGRFTVEDINIRCASHECGICINPCIQATSAFVNKVGIFNVRGYGLLATKAPDVPGFASRPLFLQNMTILGTADYPQPCVGIQLGERIGDNRLANIEIMGTRAGLVQEASFVYATNMHIWTGCLAQKDNDQWWETTRSIVLGNGDASFMGDNIYLDTSYVLIEMHSHRNMLSINNFMSWEDGSIRGCSKTNAKLFHISPTLTDFPNINMMSGIIYLSGNDDTPGKLCDLTVPAPNARIENVRILNNYRVNYKNYKRLSFLRTDAPSYGGIAKPSDTEQYVRIAAVAADAKNGSCEFTYTADNGERAAITIEQKAENAHVKLTKGRFSDGNFYCKYEEKFFTFYVRVPANQPELRYTIHTHYASDRFFPLDLGLLKDHHTYETKTEVLPNADGLTKLEEV